MRQQEFHAISNNTSTSTSAVCTLEQAELAIRRAGIVQNDMVEGRQLLEICGFDTSSSNQATVFKRQIEKHELREGQDFTASMQQSTGGRPKTAYHFTINAANHILLAAMTPEGKAARQEAIDMKLDEALGASMLQVEVVSRSCVELAKIFGLEGNQALLSASNAAKKMTGIDPIALLGVELVSDRKEKTFTPTEMGREPEFDNRSGQKMNALLALADLQKNINSQWELTEKGKQFAEVVDTGRKHGSGVPVKQIRWYRSVIAEILPLL